MHTRHGRHAIGRNLQLFCSGVRKMIPPALQVQHARDELQAVHDAVVNLARQDVCPGNGISGMSLTNPLINNLASGCSLATTRHPDTESGFWDRDEDDRQADGNYKVWGPLALPLVPELSSLGH